MIQKCENIVKFIQGVYNTKEFIPLHEPKFIGNEKKYLNECIDSTFVSSVGKFVNKFEKDFAAYVGSSYAIATVNGTSALHIALLLADVQEDDEVITQALTFVATANAISYCQAKPIFIDVDLDTLGLSPKALKSFLKSQCKIINNQCINNTTKKIIKACIPMHTFGHPCKIDAIQDICKSWHLELIEDSAESLGSYYKNKHTGTFGKLGIFSFNGNKIITSGGGGVIVTDNEELAKKAKHLTTTAKIPHSYEYVHDEIAYNYRMPNLNAALLCAQLENLNNYIENKRTLALEYKEFFSQMDDIEFMAETENTKANYWLNALIFKTQAQRDLFLKTTNDNKVMTRPIWKLLSELKMYESSQSDSLINSKYLQTRVVNIPSSVR